MSSAEDEPYYESKAGVAAYGEMTKKAQPFLDYVLYYTIATMTGDVSGKAILDLGCGDGRMCERMMRSGASKVVGCDLSEEMIAQCKSRKIPNAVFEARDCRELGKLDTQFDIAVSIFVIHYMPDYESVVAFIKSAYDNLKPGGVFCGVLTAYESDQPLTGSIPMNLVRYERESNEEFSEVKMIIETAEPPITMINYVLRPCTIEKAMKEAGFTEVVRRPFLISDEGKQHFDEKDTIEQLTVLFPFLAKK